MITLEAVVIPAAFIVSTIVKSISFMITARIGAGAAAAKAAAEFEYFRDVSESQLTAISLELARKHPQYPEWQWFRLLSNLKKYGMMEESRDEPPAAPDQVQAGMGTGTILILGAVGLLAVFMIGGSR